MIDRKPFIKLKNKNKKNRQLSGFKNE